MRRIDGWKLATGEHVGGVPQPDPMHLPHEVQNVAARAAPEALEAPAAVVDREGGRLFPVKRTAGLQFGPSTLEH